MASKQPGTDGAAASQVQPNKPAIMPAAAGGTTYNKNLLEQLPAGAVLAYQALAATFTNQGNCFRSNWWLTVGLVTFISATCIFFSFTDSVVDRATGKSHNCIALPGRLHIINLSVKEQRAMPAADLKERGLKPVDWVHAILALVVFLTVAGSDVDRATGKSHNCIALPGRLHIINLSVKEQRAMPAADLKERGLKPVDWVHAILALVVFLTVAGSDVGLQNCFFPKAGDDTRQLLRNLPLGMAVMASFLFMIFPTTRKGIRFDNNASHSPPPAAAPPPPAAAPAPNNAAQNKVAAAPAAPNNAAQNKDADQAAAATAAAADDASSASSRVDKVTDKVLTSSANLSQLLPTGTVLAFQTLSASFTNQGMCFRSNWWLTVGLVTFLTASCIFFSFTDSVKDSTGKVHTGVALPGRLHVRDLPVKERKAMAAQLKKLRVTAIDWIHAFFTAVVFLTIAGSDVGLQNCFFPKAGDDTKQLLKNLPLGMAVMSSFVFMIFPTTRKGFSFDDRDDSSAVPKAPDSGASSNSNRPRVSP